MTFIGSMAIAQSVTMLMPALVYLQSVSDLFEANFFIRKLTK